MPYIFVTTNVNVDAKASEHLLSSLTDLVITKLGKPKEYVQVAVNGGQSMQFAGTGEPTAFVELRALGLSDEAAKLVAPELTTVIGEALSISPDRIFINLLDVPRSRWGWNGATFG
jgi:phenylpyruvate tautomerase